MANVTLHLTVGAARDLAALVRRAADQAPTVSERERIRRLEATVAGALTERSRAHCARCEGTGRIYNAVWTAFHREIATEFEDYIPGDPQSPGYHIVQHLRTGWQLDHGPEHLPCPACRRRAAR